MTYRKKSWEEGRLAEESFVKWAEAKGFAVEKSKPEEQFKHIDFYITKGGVRLSIDVKAKKRLSRSDKESQNTLIWVEFKNVLGRDGWLVSGPDAIAFEAEDGFVLIPRIELHTLCLKKCDLTVFAQNSQDALYKAYKRKDRPKEIISMIYFSDILSIYEN